MHEGPESKLIRGAFCLDDSTSVTRARKPLSLRMFSVLIVVSLLMVETSSTTLIATEITEQTGGRQCRANRREVPSSQVRSSHPVVMESTVTNQRRPATETKPVTTVETHWSVLDGVDRQLPGGSQHLRDSRIGQISRPREHAITIRQEQWVGIRILVGSRSVIPV